MKKYIVLFAAIVLNMCLGGTYAWTVISSSICESSDISEATARLPYTIFYSAFPLTVVFGSVLLKKLNTRVGAMFGGGLFGLGWIIASLGASNFWFTIIGAGVIGGIGVGIAYVIPISTCIAWFPEKRGMVTGLIVGGFAGGAAIVSQVAKALAATGTSPFSVLLYCGIAFLVFSLISGSFMIEPKASSDSIQGHPESFAQLFKNPTFQLLFVGMTFGLIAGFFVNANLRQFALNNALSMTMTGAAIFAIGNAFGRVLWGTFSDHCSTGRALRLNLIAQAILMVCATFLVKSVTSMCIFAALTGFNYGGVLVVYAGSVARIWGADKVGSIYGWMFSANIPGAVAPLFAGYCYDQTGNFTVPMFAIAVIILAAIVLLNLNKKSFVT